MTPMKINDLRDSLVDTFKNIKDGTIKPADAKEIANVAGKILASAKLELEYNMFLEKRKSIPFLEPNRAELPKKTDAPKQLSSDPIRLEGNQASNYYVTMAEDSPNAGFFVLVIADNATQVLHAMNKAYGKGNWGNIYTEEEFSELNKDMKQLTEINTLTT